MLIYFGDGHRPSVFFIDKTPSLWFNNNKIKIKKEQKMEQKFKKTSVVCVLAMVCCILWGSAFPCIKIGYSLFAIPAGDTASQILFAGLRFTLAGILAWLFGSLIAKKPMLPPKEAYGKIALLSLFQTVLQYLFFYVGLAHTTGVKSSVIKGADVFICILFSALVFRLEKLTPKKIIGCVIGMAGVIIINLAGGSIDMNVTFLGEGFIVLSMFAHTMSSVLIKLFSKKHNPVMLSSFQFTLGGIVMTLCGLIFGGSLPQVNTKGVMMLIYLALVSSAAYSLWSVLLKYNPVSRISVFGFMNPVFGVILSALLLNETDQAFSLNAVIALVLICTGIIIVNKTAKNQ